MRELGVDDMEYVEELGIDESLAYTPEINHAILDAVEANNYDLYIDEGNTPEESTRLAKTLRAKGDATIAEAERLRKNPKNR